MPRPTSIQASGLAGFAARAGQAVKDALAGDKPDVPAFRQDFGEGDN